MSINDDRDSDVNLCGCFLIFGKEKNIKLIRRILFDSEREPQEPIICSQCGNKTFLQYDLKLIYQTLASKKLYVLSEDDIRDALDGKMRRIEDIYEKRKRGENVGRRERNNRSTKGKA